MQTTSYSLFSEKENYEYAYVNSKTNKFETKELDNNKGDSLINDFHYLQKYNDLILFYHSLKKSLHLFDSYLGQLDINTGKYTDYADANSLLLSLLANFYSLIEFCEKNIDYFKNEGKQFIYDKYFSYRLFYELRKFLTHRGLAINKFTSKFENNSFSTSAVIDVNLLCSDSKIKQSFKDEIILKGKELNIADYFNDFANSINELMFNIFIHYESEIVFSFERIKHFLDNNCCSYYNAILKDKKGNHHGFLKSLNNFLNTFTQEIIYGNNIDDKPNISIDMVKMINSLSYIYFGINNCFVKKE